MVPSQFKQDTGRGKQLLRRKLVPAENVQSLNIGRRHPGKATCNPTENEGRLVLDGNEFTLGGIGNFTLVSSDTWGDTLHHFS